MAASADSPKEPKDVAEAYFIIPKWSRRGKDMERHVKRGKPAAGQQQEQQHSSQEEKNCQVLCSTDEMWPSKQDGASFSSQIEKSRNG